MKNFILRSALLMIFVAFSGCSSDDSSDCPQGFTGSDCNNKITPSKMFINKIVVKQYPVGTTDSEFWDTGEDSSGFPPDILLALTFEDGTTLVNDDIRTDCTGEASFQIVPSLVLGEINEDLVLLSVFDYDGGDGSSSDIMAQKYFQLYTSAGSTFPSIIRLTDLQQLLDVEIYVTYEWY